MPDSDPASPVYIKDGRSLIKCGMTPFLDSLKKAPLLAGGDSHVACDVTEVGQGL